MPNHQLQATINNRNLIFLNTGVVEEHDPTGAVLKSGTWHTDSALKANTITYHLASETGSVIQATYTFDSDNILSIVIPVQPGVAAASAPGTFNGKIEVDHDWSLSYQFVDDTGSGTGLIAVEIYGTIVFDNKLDLLTIRTSAGDTALTGYAPTATMPVLNATTQIIDWDVLDVLQFHAKTQNTKADGTKFASEATIKFSGNWDLYDDQLQFVGSYDSTSKPNLKIAFVGKVKATEFGLALFLGPDGQSKLALHVQGTYEWTGGATSQWKLDLGSAEKTKAGNPIPEIHASFDYKGTPTITPNNDPSRKTVGRKLAMDGTFTLDSRGTAGGKMAIDASLSITATFETGSLQFKASEEAGSYSLELEGTFAVTNGKVTFDLKYNSKGTVSISFGYVTAGSDLAINLNVLLGPDGWKVDVSIKWVWANGKSGPGPKSIGSAPAAAAPALAIANQLLAAPLAAPAVAPVAAAPSSTQADVIGKLQERIYLGKGAYQDRDIQVYSIPGKSGYLFKAKMAIDADGSPKAYHPTDDSKALDYLQNSTPESRTYIQGRRGVGPADGFYVSATALNYGPPSETATYVDAETIPYFVMPGDWRPDVMVGDVGVIVNLRNDKVTHAIFGDVNPRVGEASIKAGQNLGVPNVSAKNGGDDYDHYVYVVFPGSILEPVETAPHWPDQVIQARAMQLFQDLGGLPAVKAIYS